QGAVASVSGDRPIHGDVAGIVAAADAQDAGRHLTQLGVAQPQAAGRGAAAETDGARGRARLPQGDDAGRARLDGVVRREHDVVGADGDVAARGAGQRGPDRTARVVRVQGEGAADAGGQVDGPALGGDARIDPVRFLNGDVPSGNSGDGAGAGAIDGA